MDGQRKSGRYAHAEAILGSELVNRLADTKVLLVGAGGIGCELRQSESSLFSHHEIAVLKLPVQSRTSS